MAMSATVDKCREHSEKKCLELREGLEEVLHADSDNTVLVCGSYARREAAGPSDVDYFLVSNEESRDTLASRIWQRCHRKRLIGRINEVVVGLDLKKPSPGGPFANRSTRRSIVQNIGGANDSNANITQRVLMLLEGDWLFNEKGFRSLRREILCTYVKDGVPDDQVALFLLNDIIRYWRTVCVDYEYKTTEEDKPWAIRNIKLVFSRKLIYASGLFSVALTAGRSRESKIKCLEELFDLPPLNRIVHVCGKASTAQMVRCYEVFLDRISNDADRKHLESLERDCRADPLFRDLKNEGHQFTCELVNLFETKFDSTHPIRKAIIY